jgi:multidrug resistance efflux pump
MKNQELPPIPTPIETQWREFRYQYMPFITFLSILAVIVVMWRNYVMPSSLVAQAEPIAVRLISPVPGTLVQLNVERYQDVTKGQIIAVVQSMDSNSLASSLSTIQSDLEMMRARMSLTQTRNEQNYYQEYLLFRTEQAQLEENKVNMLKAQADFLRASNLFVQTTPLESQANYDLARYTFLGLCTNVAVNERRLAEKEKMLPLLKGTNDTLMSQAVERDVQAKIDALRASQMVVLRAPIDGRVSAISNVVGEVVLQGRPIVIITALECTNIIGFARQPLNTTPKVNDLVMVRRQTFKRDVAYARVTQVGTQFEPIVPALLGPSSSTRYGYDVGLPFLVAIPSTMKLSPGEHVDLVLNPKNPPAGNGN